MASPIEFKPKKVDPKFELERRLRAAPLEHAESLLVALDLLEEAHTHGILDMMHGAVGSKDAILGRVAEFAKQPESTAAVRNLIVLGRLLGSIDPEALKAEPPANPPSLWRMLMGMRSVEARRGLSRMLSVVTALGRAKP